MTQNKSLALFLVVMVALALLVSAIRPYDLLTWFLEVAPVLIAAPILYFTRSRFPLTPLLMVLIAIHALILILGGHYSYAEVPLGDWMRDWFEFDRNHYDRIGHFAQGFIPAMVAREILLRMTPLQSGRMIAFLCLCIALAISSAYELIEMAVALISGAASDAFLGTQGDPWDTQMDMYFAMLGAATSLAFLQRWHDRQLTRLKSRKSN